VTENGGKGGNRTLDPGIMSAKRTHSPYTNNNLRIGCAGFRRPLYVSFGLAPDKYRHTSSGVSQ
jgi:hypothetical protein